MENQVSKRVLENKDQMRTDSSLSGHMADGFIYLTTIGMNKSNNMGKMTPAQSLKLSKEKLVNTLLGQQAAEPTAKPKTVIPVKLASPEFLTQLAAEKLEQSIERPATKTIRDKIMPTLPQNVKNKIKHYEKLSDKQASTSSVDKQPRSLQDMRTEELAKARV